jgi:hypothetical protein
VTSLRHHTRDLVYSINELCSFEHVLNESRIVHCNVLLASYETIGIPFPGRECPKVLDPKGLLEAQEKGLEVFCKVALVCDRDIPKLGNQYPQIARPRERLSNARKHKDVCNIDHRGNLSSFSYPCCLTTEA